MNKKAIALLSGGLDSILATRLVREQGVEIEAINFMTTFCTCTHKGCQHAATTAAKQLDVPLKIVNISEEFLEVIRKPAHGYGSNMNPCIDCRILTFSKARDYMRERGASFIVTGEVLGERPMSQRRDAIMLIEREAKLKGLILRPLSAKHFDPTIPEKEGIVDREKLLDISGRSRKPQIELARAFGINDYPCPAGGCLLTDPGFARRMRDLLAHDSLVLDNVKLLKCGRHFRLGPRTKLVVGRDEKDNEMIERHAKPGDTLLRLADHPGPAALLRGPADDALIARAAAVVAHHTRQKLDAAVGIAWRAGERSGTVAVAAASLDEIELIRL